MSDKGYEGPLFSGGGVLGKAASRADAGKRIVHTIDPDFITGIGRVSAFGAKKYHQRNFLMAPGMEWGRVYDSLIGHLQAFWGGEAVDAESGELHILHAAWNLMVLHQYSTHDVYAPGDDRPATIEHMGKSWKEWQEKFFEAQGMSPANTDPTAPPSATVPREDEPGAYGIFRGHVVNVYCTKKGYPAKFNISGVDSLKMAVKRGDASLQYKNNASGEPHPHIKEFEDPEYWYFVGTARIPLTSAGE